MELCAKKHIRYFHRFLNSLPGSVSSSDPSRTVMCFFAVSGLDLLGAIDELNEEKKKEICDWIYHLQVVPNCEDISDGNTTLARWGFQGSSMLISSKTDIIDHSEQYACGHVSMTYAALISLVILGDDLSRVNKKALVRGVRACQQPDGSFCATLSGSECDMRFVYSAAAVCYILQDWDGMDIKLATSYILESLSYDYGFAQGPGLESHGGHTFCAVASLALMGNLHTVLSEKQIRGLQRWCLLRQESGFQGRPNKQVDTCYSFWIGATLQILGCYDMIDKKENREFILGTQDCIIGGFSKWPATSVDPLHSYLALGGLSLLKEPGTQSIHPELNFSQRAVEHLHKLHGLWRCGSL